MFPETDKEIGLMCQNDTLTGCAKKFIFSARKKDFLNKVKIPGPERDGLFDRFYPAGVQHPIVEDTE